MRTLFVVFMLTFLISCGMTDANLYQVPQGEFLLTSSNARSELIKREQVFWYQSGYINPSTASYIDCWHQKIETCQMQSNNDYPLDSFFIGGIANFFNMQFPSSFYQTLRNWDRQELDRGMAPIANLNKSLIGHDVVVHLLRSDLGYPVYGYSSMMYSVDRLHNSKKVKLFSVENVGSVRVVTWGNEYVQIFLPVTFYQGEFDEFKGQEGFYPFKGLRSFIPKEFFKNSFINVAFSVSMNLQNGNRAFARISLEEDSYDGVPTVWSKPQDDGGYFITDATKSSIGYRVLMHKFPSALFLDSGLMEGEDPDEYLLVRQSHLADIRSIKESKEQLAREKNDKKQKILKNLYEKYGTVPELDRVLRQYAIANKTKSAISRKRGNFSSSHCNRGNYKEWCRSISDDLNKRLDLDLRALRDYKQSLVSNLQSLSDIKEWEINRLVDGEYMYLVRLEPGFIANHYGYLDYDLEEEYHNYSDKQFFTTSKPKSSGLADFNKLALEINTMLYDVNKNSQSQQFQRSNATSLTTAKNSTISTMGNRTQSQITSPVQAQSNSVQTQLVLNSSNENKITSYRIVVEATAFCYKNEKQAWYCAGPTQTLWTPEKTLQSALRYVGCEKANMSRKRQFHSTKSNADGYVYYCEKAMEGSDTDIALHHNYTNSLRQNRNTYKCEEYQMARCTNVYERGKGNVSNRTIVKE